MTCKNRLNWTKRLFRNFMQYLRKPPQIIYQNTTNLFIYLKLAVHLLFQACGLKQAHFSSVQSR